MRRNRDLFMNAIRSFNGWFDGIVFIGLSVVGGECAMDTSD